MMAITESDLRDLLADESRGGPVEGVTVADVDRRVRRIRRRRLAAATGVLTAGLVVVGALTVPRAVTAEAPDDVWTAVMAQPSPSSSPSPSGRLPSQWRGVAVLAHKAYEQAGVKRRLTFQAGELPLSVYVECPGSPSYVIVWLNGVREPASQPGGSFDRRRRAAHASGYGLVARRRVRSVGCFS
ncbi:hypothetical protein [Microtetraspora glauca]|uniref:Anti-sigma factor n=1 Tax=Microtetraspora glauca TaxID=1996 RepID=A0ABV3G8V6_MICGL